MRSLKLEQICDFKRGTAISQKSVLGGNVPVIAGGREPAYFHNISNRKENIITISSSGAYAGCVNYFKCPIFASDCFTIKPKDESEVCARFLFFWLKSKQDYIYSLQSGSGQPHVYPKDLAKLTIHLPFLKEQKRMATILDAADALRTKRSESIALLDILLQSTFLDMFGGAIDNGWVMATVKEVASNEKGAIRTGPFGSQLLHSEFVDEGIRVLGIDNVVANEFREGERRYITSEKYKKLRRYTVRPGDVLITIMGTCGRCAVVPDDVGLAVNTKHLCCITLDWRKCMPSFMHYYFLKHPVAQRYLKQKAKGAIMNGLNMGIVRELPIPVPPIDLQRRFTTIVESIECQKARLRAHLAELNTLFSSLEQRAFNEDL